MQGPFTAAMVGLKSSMPLSKELIVGFSQNVPAKVPTDALAVLEVAPGAEDAAIGRQDPDPGVLLVAEPVPGRVQVVAEGAVDGVASLGAVKGDGGDVVFQLIGDEAHGCTLVSLGHRP